MVPISIMINYLKFKTIQILIWNHRGDIIFHTAIKYKYKQEVIISSISLPFIIENQSRGIPQNPLNQNQKPKKIFCMDGTIIWISGIFHAVPCESMSLDLIGWNRINCISDVIHYHASTCYTCCITTLAN